MKINSSTTSSKSRLSSDSKTNKKSKSSAGGIFRRFFETQSIPSDQSNQRSSFQVDVFLKEIDTLGIELLKQRSMGAMERYRAKIKEILEHFNQSHERLGVDAVTFSGKHQKLFLIKQINENLIELTHEVIGKEKSHAFLKEKPISENDKYKAVPTLIDSIKGLLIDFLR